MLEDLNQAPAANRDGHPYHLLHPDMEDDRHEYVSMYS